MELDSRKIMILKAVIRNYMETGEPVGSRTISKLPECSFSSATIRRARSFFVIRTSAARVRAEKTGAFPRLHP